MTRPFALLCCLLGVVLAGPAVADSSTVDVPLVEGKPYLHVITEGRSVKVERIQDPDFELKGYYARTARKCPPFCLHAMEAAPGVKVIGEVELFDFMEGPLRDGTGEIIDARTPDWFKKGTIPGAISLPFDQLVIPASDPKWDEIFKQFGAKPRDGAGLGEKLMQAIGLDDDPLKTDKWDFTGAKSLVLFCNGPACDQSPRAIKGLIAAGYPASKLFYYRGGMQMWELWGLTVLVPGQ